MKKKNLLFIIDPIGTLLPNDTTFAIMAEAFARGHAVWITTVSEICVRSGGAAHAAVTRIAAYSKPKMRWKILGNKDAALEGFSLIFMRKNPPYDIGYVFATLLLSLVNAKKTFIINDPAALRNFNEKLGVLQFQRFIPDTIVTKRRGDIIAFLKKHKKIVLKPLGGFGGQEVVVLDGKDKNRNALLEMLTRRQSRYVTAQKYIPEVKHGDKRVLVLNGEILGQENRVAASDDHRSNISAGGTSHKTSLTAKETKMCEAVGKVLASQGIYFAGLDLIGGYITEINVTSPTGLVEMSEYEGKRLERKVVDFLENKTDK